MAIADTHYCTDHAQFLRDLWSLQDRNQNLILSCFTEMQGDSTTGKSMEMYEDVAWT